MPFRLLGERERAYLCERAILPIAYGFLAPAYPETR